ncbi:2-(1,2-epoxy-1,2-dihydrophenyl)acetyl-CoA isomerase PaaG [Stakelama sediminis]|uniref:2-(1,2-epoxy-1,2-dihydrophenyl)acetyl-CoA isomerase n=1 Tax=Stakelama sediminis TaxID=463200 RepID=A0A840YW22_9SPHN|nr:enoyl-CoA hydratase-related protein [Stakelama sediminis]MBB5717911.1 2-(1,2-epoxy-1,2-dihydrophenyl)acetyl-CoA isomerase [Stakelama sediminis]
MADYQTILFDLSEDVATITLNRPERLNAITADMLAEIRDALDEATAGGARALLLNGDDRAFCSGADLQAAAASGGGSDLGESLTRDYNPTIAKLAALDMPVVSAVSGLAAGAGASLALHADFTIAAKSAYFLLAFVNIGLVPDAGATWLFAQAMGRTRTLEAAMLGERIYADRAEEYGLIYRVVADNHVEKEARALAVRLAAGPTLAYGMIRKSVAAALTSSLEEVLAIEAADQRRAGQSADCREGVAAFIEKRDAVFTGK